MQEITAQENNKLRHSINHPHDMQCEFENDSISPFGFVFGIRAGQEIDCDISGVFLSIDLVIEILQYLSVAEIISTRRISKFFNHAASIYLSKLNDAFVEIGILSEVYVFSNFYKKRKLENDCLVFTANIFEENNFATQKDGKNIILDFRVSCFDITQNDLNEIELPSSYGENNNNLINKFIANCKLPKVGEIISQENNKNISGKLDNTLVEPARCAGANLLLQKTKEEDPYDSILSYVSHFHLSKNCKKNHIHLCHQCASDYKKNICKHIYCPMDYHRNCTGDASCEYHCVCGDESVENDNGLQSANNIDPSGQYSSTKYSPTQQYPSGIPTNDPRLLPSGKNTKPVSRSASNGSACVLSGEFQVTENYDSVLPIIHNENHEIAYYRYFHRTPHRQSDIVKCDCGRHILISFKENLSVKNLTNHLLLQARITGNADSKQHKGLTLKIVIPQIIRNYEAINGPCTWRDLVMISNFIKAANNQVKLDHLQKQICDNYKRFKVSSMENVEFYSFTSGFNHPSIYSDELHPIQCMHEHGFCAEMHNCYDAIKVDAAIEQHL